MLGTLKQSRVVSKSDWTCFASFSIPNNGISQADTPPEVKMIRTFCIVNHLRTGVGEVRIDLNMHESGDIRSHAEREADHLI